MADIFKNIVFIFVPLFLIAFLYMIILILKENNIEVDVDPKLSKSVESFNKFIRQHSKYYSTGAKLASFEDMLIQQTNKKNSKRFERYSKRLKKIFSTPNVIHPLYVEL